MTSIAEFIHSNKDTVATWLNAINISYGVWGQYMYKRGYKFEDYAVRNFKILGWICISVAILSQNIFALMFAVMAGFVLNGIVGGFTMWVVLFGGVAIIKHLRSLNQ